ncbi:MAG: aspartate kinase [Bacteroidota bacterium]
MKVFKFGGASVKTASAVKNVAGILKSEQPEEIIVVISAMGKTTNALEDLVDAYFHGKPGTRELCENIKTFHFEILTELFPTPNWVFQEVHTVFEDLYKKLQTRPSANYDYEYDQIVSLGEIVSTIIVSGYLKNTGCAAEWLDARQLIRTDRMFREGKVDWNITLELIQRELSKPEYQGKTLVTQGFIGHTPENQTTTLGREGSDYTAGILAWCMDAESVTIWKDVPGMLNADPKWFDNTVRLPHISYKEAIELSYYGATVIHPKTIKPLQNKNIPLYVRSFVSPSEPGTGINDDASQDHLIPSFIFKINQLLISISPKDFSFVVEENLRDIFDTFSKSGVKINLMQNSALDFSVVVDESPKARTLIEELRNSYKVLFNENQELVTIRHYDQQTIDRVLEGKKVLVEQRTRQTLRMVIN